MELLDSTNFGKAINEACCICHGSTFKTTYPSLEPSSSPSTSSLPTIEPIPSSSPSDCEDEPNWFFDPEKRLGCKSIISDPVDFCYRLKDVDYNGKTVMNACCICQGGIHKSREPSIEPSVSQIPSATPTETIAPSFYPSDLPSTTPSESMIPSQLPSTIGTIIDGKTCKYNLECKSGSCANYVCERGVSIFWFTFTLREL